MGAILALLNSTLPGLIALYKLIRAEVPGDPSLTDAQIIALLKLDSDAIVAQADEWLAQHPNDV